MVNIVKKCNFKCTYHEKNAGFIILQGLCIGVFILGGFHQMRLDSRHHKGILMTLHLYRHTTSSSLPCTLFSSLLFFYINVKIQTQLNSQYASCLITLKINMGCYILVNIFFIRRTLMLVTVSRLFLCNVNIF